MKSAVLLGISTSPNNRYLQSEFRVWPSRFLQVLAVLLAPPAILNLIGGIGSPLDDRSTEIIGFDYGLSPCIFLYRYRTSTPGRARCSAPSAPIGTFFFLFVSLSKIPSHVATPNTRIYLSPARRLPFSALVLLAVRGARLKLELLLVFKKAGRTGFEPVLQALPFHS